MQSVLKISATSDDYKNVANNFYSQEVFLKARRLHTKYFTISRFLYQVASNFQIYVMSNNWPNWGDEQYLGFLLSLSSE